MWSLFPKWCSACSHAFGFSVKIKILRGLFYQNNRQEQGMIAAFMQIKVLNTQLQSFAVFLPQISMLNVWKGHPKQVAALQKESGNKAWWRTLYAMHLDWNWKVKRTGKPLTDSGLFKVCLKSPFLLLKGQFPNSKLSVIGEIQTVVSLDKASPSSRNPQSWTNCTNFSGGWGLNLSMGLPGTGQLLFPPSLSLSMLIEALCSNSMYIQH